MYESTFEMDWEGISQEEAMFRAYAIGVDAALGHTHPEALRRLMGEFHRGLIQIAFDEGKSRASDELRARGHDPDDDSGTFESGEYEWEVWETLVTDRAEEPDAFETVRVSRSRDDLPGALERPEMLARSDEDLTTLQLPRFLLR